MLQLHYFDDDAFRRLMDDCDLVMDPADFSELTSNGYLTPTEQGYSALHACLVKKWLDYAKQPLFPWTGKRLSNTKLRSPFTRAVIDELKGINHDINALLNETASDKEEALERVKGAIEIASPFGIFASLAEALNADVFGSFNGLQRLFLEQMQCFRVLMSPEAHSELEEAIGLEIEQEEEEIQYVDMDDDEEELELELNEEEEETHEVQSSQPPIDAEDIQLELDRPAQIETVEEKQELQQPAQTIANSQQTAGIIPPPSSSLSSLASRLKPRGLGLGQRLGNDPATNPKANAPLGALSGLQAGIDRLNQQRANSNEQAPQSDQQQEDRFGLRPNLELQINQPGGEKEEKKEAPAETSSLTNIKDKLSLGANRKPSLLGALADKNTAERAAYTGGEKNSERITGSGEKLEKQEVSKTISPPLGSSAAERILNRVSRSRTSLAMPRGLTDSGNESDMATVVEAMEDTPANSRLSQPMSAVKKSTGAHPSIAHFATPRVNNSKISQFLSEKGKTPQEEEEELELSEPIEETGQSENMKSTAPGEKASSGADEQRPERNTHGYLRPSLSIDSSVANHFQFNEEVAGPNAPTDVLRQRSEAALKAVAQKNLKSKTGRFVGALEPPAEPDQSLETVDMARPSVDDDIINFDLLGDNLIDTSDLNEDLTKEHVSPSAYGAISMEEQDEAPLELDEAVDELRQGPLVDFSDLIDFDDMGDSFGNKDEKKAKPVAAQPVTLSHAFQSLNRADVLNKNQDKAQQIQQLNEQRQRLTQEGNWAGVAELIEARIDLFPEGEERQQAYLSLANIYEQHLNSPTGAMKSYIAAISENGSADLVLTLNSLHQVGLNHENASDYVTWLNEAIQSPKFSQFTTYLRRNLSDANAAAGNISAAFYTRASLLLESPESLHVDDLQTMIRWAQKARLAEDIFNFFHEIDLERLPKSLNVQFAYEAGATIMQLGQNLHAVPFYLFSLRAAKDSLKDGQVDPDIIYASVSDLVRIYQGENNWQEIVSLLDEWLDKLPPNSRPDLRSSLDEAFARDAAMPDVIDRYVAVYKQNPNDINNVTRLAQLYANKGQPHESVQLLRDSYKVASNEQRPHILLQLAYIAEHNVNQGDAALEYYKQVNNFAPSVESHKGTARLCHERQDWPGVIASINYLIAHKEEIHFEERIAYINMGLDAANALEDDATYQTFVMAMNDT